MGIPELKEKSPDQIDVKSVWEDPRPLIESPKNQVKKKFPGDDFDEF